VRQATAIVPTTADAVSGGGGAAGEGLAGAADPDVVAAATAAGRILISPDAGLADIRANPPGGHVGIVVLR